MLDWIPAVLLGAVLLRQIVLLVKSRLQHVEELPKPDMARVLSLVEPKLAVGDGVEA